MTVRITVDFSELNAILAHMGKAPQFVPPILDREMIRLGYNTIAIMKQVLRPRRYRGILEDSVDARYNHGTKVLSVGPEGQRGKLGGWDAGLILELGAHPQRPIPWQPIKEWAMFRGKPVEEAYFILRKMRKVGVKKHPFLMDVLNNPQFQMALEATAGRVGTDIAAAAVAGGKPIGAAVTQ